MAYLEDYKHFMYNDKKEIKYDWTLRDHKAIKLNRKDGFIDININEVSISMPQEKFSKILENLGGQVSCEKQTFKMKKLKSDSNIKIFIKDKNGNEEESEIYSPHFNTHDWEQFKNYILGYEPLMILTLGREIETYDKTKKQEIGYSLWVYNFNNLSLDQMYEKKEYRSSLRDHYTYETNILETNLEWKEKRFEFLIKGIEEYLEVSERPILVQNLEEIQNILNIDLPKDRIYNFDDLLEYDKFIEAKNHYLSKNLMIYIDAPHQNGLTLSKLYFDKEIIKNPNNNLDKLIENSKEIEKLDPILHFNI